MKEANTLLITVTAIICITILAAIALIGDMPEWLLAVAFSAIAGLGGYTVRNTFKRQ